MSISLHPPRPIASTKSVSSRSVRLPLGSRRMHGLAVKIATCYLVASICWVVYSDKLAQLLPFGPDEQEIVSAYKGLAYAALVTILLFLLLRRREIELAQSEQARLEAEEQSRQSLTNAQLAGRTGYWTLELRSRKLWCRTRWCNSPSCRQKTFAAISTFSSAICRQRTSTGSTCSVSEHFATAARST